MVKADVGEVAAEVVGVKLNGFAPVAGAPVCAWGLKAKLPPGVDGWGAGHGEDAFVAGVGPKGLGPGVGVDTSGVVVVPGQLVGVEPNVLVLVLLPNKFVPEVLLLPPNKFVLLLLLLNIVLLLMA